MNKKAVIHLHNGVLLDCKKEGNFTLCDSMDDLENIKLSEISQSVKDEYYMIRVIYGI